MQPLTKRQREILDYLAAFIADYGYAPSLEEIGRRFGLTSLATVHKHMTHLERKGAIVRRWNRSRSVEIVNEHAAEPPRLVFIAGFQAACRGELLDDALAAFFATGRLQKQAECISVKADDGGVLRPRPPS